MISIRLENVYKVFGDHPYKALQLLKDGKTKAEIQKNTGIVIEVQNVSFKLSSGELFCEHGAFGQC